MIVWKSIIVLFATLLAACNGIDHTVQPTLRSKDGKLEVTITIGPVLYNNSITGLVQNLVGYNGVVGGPTLYVKPGDELTVTLINDLPKEPCNTNVPALHNSYHAVDITNLHFHGLHIAEKYNPMHLELQPGDTYTYKFKIPGHHQGGTHWYHPHPPGSTSLQAGGGAVGLLIVEDLEGDIPQDILELPDLNLRVQFLNMTYLQDDYAAGTVAGTSGSYVDLCKAHCLPEANRPLCKEFFFEDGPLEGEYNTTMSPDGLEYETTLVNGIEQPTIEIIKDQWYRARILHVPTRFRTLEPAFPNCEVRLLAKDGLYMLETPRNVSSGFMTSGSRADFLVRCSEVGMQEFRSLSLARDSSNWIASQKRPSLDRVLAYLNVVEGIGRMGEYSNPKDIEVFKPSRPCYLADMRDVVPDKEDYVLMSGLLPNGGGLADDLPLDRPACCAATSYYDVNGIGAFNIDHRAEISAVNEHQYDFSVATGQIWDVDFYAPQIHPVHYHVNRYQLIELPALGAHADYFQVGDFHDTLQLTIAEYYGKAKLRFSIAGPTGPMLGHCHFYRHTDRGMAYLGEITGEEGAYSPKLEGTCFNSFETRGGFEYIDGKGGKGSKSSKSAKGDGGSKSAKAAKGDGSTKKSKKKDGKSSRRLTGKIRA